MSATSAILDSFATVTLGEYALDVFSLSYDLSGPNTWCNSTCNIAPKTFSSCVLSCDDLHTECVRKCCRTRDSKTGNAACNICRGDHTMQHRCCRDIALCVRASVTAFRHNNERLMFSIFRQNKL